MQKTIDQLTLHSEQIDNENTFQKTVEDLEMERTGLEEISEKTNTRTEHMQEEIQNLRMTLKEAEERAKATQPIMEVCDDDAIDTSSTYSGVTSDKENDALALVGEPVVPPALSVATTNSTADTSTTTM